MLTRHLQLVILATKMFNKLRGEVAATVIQANAEHHGLIMTFLQREAVYNTFLISDIQSHGYDKDYQQVHLSLDHRGACRGVYLRYFNNLILAGDATEEDAPFIVSLADSRVETVMGKAGAVAPVEARLSAPHSYARKELLHLPDGQQLTADLPARTASLSDVERVHAFLMSITEFQQIYAAKDMIKNRILNKEGQHLYLERDGQIIAHANSAAGTEHTCMLGGVAVAPKHRGQGLAKGLVSTLCRGLLAEGKTPCPFSEVPREQSLFAAIGFKKIGDWGVVALNRR